MLWKTKVYENILRFRTLNTNIRTWVDRSASGPGEEVDYTDIASWVHAHRGEIDGQSLRTTAEALAKAFPRISAVEVHNGSMTYGVLLYPRWP